MSLRLPQLGEFANAREISGPQAIAEAPAAAPTCSAWRRVSPSPIFFLPIAPIGARASAIGGNLDRDCRKPYTYNQDGADRTARAGAAQGRRGVSGGRRTRGFEGPLSRDGCRVGTVDGPT